MINSIEFYCGISREMKALKCSEMCVKTDDMIELVTRLRQAEKDAARYRRLRDGANYHKHSGPLVFITDSNGNIDDFNGHSGVLSEMDLDHEVDEAMQCK